MSVELERTLDALQQAHESGNTEDAAQLADYARQLQAEDAKIQEQNKALQSSLEEETQLRNPIAAAGVGAVGGELAGRALNIGMAKTPSVTVQGAGPYFSPGQKYAAKTGYGAGHGEQVREVVEEFKKREGALGKGKATSRLSGVPMHGQAALDYAAEKEAEALRYKALREAERKALERSTSVPGKIGAAMSKATPMSLRLLGGAGSGLQLSDAYNRFKAGDYPGAAIGAVGGLGSAAALIPHPVTRIGGAIIGGGAEALNLYRDYQKENEPPQMAGGGLVYLAGGGSPENYEMGTAKAYEPSYSEKIRDFAAQHIGRDQANRLFGGANARAEDNFNPIAMALQTPGAIADAAKGFVEAGKEGDYLGGMGNYLMGTMNVAPMLKPAGKIGKAIIPKAGEMLEDIMAKQGLINYAAPKAKMSPGLSFGETFSKPIEAPMLRPSGSGSLLPQVENPYIAEYQDVLPQVRLKKPNPDSRMEKLASDPRAHQAIQDAIRSGIDIDPKLADWYGTNRLLQGMLNEGTSFKDFEQTMKHMASSSQRNPVPQQNKMGSYLAYMDKTGQLAEPGTKMVLPKGYGSLAQGDIVNRSQRIAAGEYPFDDAIKLGKFYKSYMGYHPNNAVVDVIGTRVPTMASQNPDWLVNRLSIGNKAKGTEQIIRPREMFNRGELSMQEALKRPGFWEAAPSLTGEYAGIEDMWKAGSKQAGQPHAGSGQALGWYGSAGLEDSAGLKSKPMTWVESLEKNARDRATITGEHPLDVMKNFLRLKGHLKKGGKVK